MHFVVIILIVLYFVLFLLSRKEKPNQIPSKLLTPFYCIALFLYKRICAKRIPIPGRKQVAKDLEILHPGESKEIICTDYYVGKIAMSLLVCLLGVFFGFIASKETERNLALQASGAIARGSYKEQAQKLDLVASFEDGKERYFSIQVETQELSEQELRKLLEEFKAELPLLILRENEGLHQVTEDLELEESYEGYPFWVEWYSDVPEVVTATGSVSGMLDEAVTVELTAKIFYGDNQEALGEIVIPVDVLQPFTTEEERIQQELENMLTKEEKVSRKEALWYLPESYQGKKIQWRQKYLDYGWLLGLGGILIAVVIFFFADKDVHDNLLARRTVLKREYPDVVQKLLLYMGAGLPVRGAFQKIGSIYEQEKKEGKAEKPIYDEILYACRELQIGVSEGKVYEHWGKRTGVQEYVRLSTLLMQNLKKGNNTLLQRLKEEADKACTEQLQNSRRLGEEASTKLLLPMVLMLVVVMLLIMIPAFSSVGV